MCSPESINPHSRGRNAVIVKKEGESGAVLGHVPDALAQVLCPMLKDGTIESMTGETTEETRRAQEGTWVLGGGNMASKFLAPISYMEITQTKQTVRKQIRDMEHPFRGIQK